MDKSTLHMKDHLVSVIEIKLDWGKGDTWSNKDFEELSERIFTSTNKRLSVTTLKRIWGRAGWVANPSTATLDILSQFIDYGDWREFVRANKQDQLKQKDLKKTKQHKVGILLIALALISSLLGFFLDKDPIIEKKSEVKTVYAPEDFVFTSRPVSTGIPNSVVFDYDASAAEDDAKVEIQQSWDNTKRITIDKKDSVATCIYYHPGFFKSKLVVDSVIVKQEDVFITTEDWLGIIQNDPRPIYLNSSDLIKNGKMAISTEVLERHNLDPRTDPVLVSFYQVKDFGELFTDNFEMSATLKNDFKEGVSGACQVVRLFILFDGSAIGIPLAKKGCVSALNLMTFEEYVDGKKNDLSSFGVDFGDFVELKCIAKNQKLDILINNSKVYQMDVPEKALKIKGISIHFEGAGSVKNVNFKKDGAIVYTSDF